MWTCPKCRRECDTPFCPTCGYQMPNQYSEVDLLEEQLKNVKKFSKWLSVLSWIWTAALTVYFLLLWIHNITYTDFAEFFSFFVLYSFLTLPLLLSIFVSKYTIKLWQNTIGFLKNNR